MRRFAFILAVLLFSLVATATILNQFTNTETAENITFVDNQNITRYFRLFNNSNVTTTRLDLRGFGHEWCYQESANVSTSCGGLSTGNYTLTKANMSDGDWDTYSSFISGADDFLVNYSKPLNALDTSLLMIKFCNEEGIENVTIPQECWEESTISFRINNPGLFYCYNGSGCNISSGISCKLVVIDHYCNLTLYEEAMWWDFNVSPTNISIDTFNNTVIDYRNETVWNRSNVSGSETRLDFNLTEVNRLRTNCSCFGCNMDNDSYTFPMCTFPIVFESNDSGILEISNINITYHIEPSNVTHGGKLNYTQSVSRGTNYSFSLNISHDYDPDVNQKALYNITFIGAPATTNFTISANWTQVYVSEELTNLTLIQLNVSSTATNGVYELNISILENNSGYSSNEFPINITIATYSAVVSFNDTSAWSLATTSTTFSKSFIVNNTGSWNASNCSFSTTGTLNSYISQNVTMFNITNGSIERINVTFSSVPSTTYNEFLRFSCNGTDSAGTVTSGDISMAIAISAPSPIPSGGGGGGEPKVEEIYLTETTELMPDLFAKYIINFFPFTYRTKRYNQTFYANKKMRLCMTNNTKVRCFIDEEDRTKGYLEITVEKTDSFFINIEGTNTVTAIDNTIGRQPFIFKVINWGWILPFTSINSNSNEGGLGIPFLVVIIAGFGLYIIYIKFII